MADKHLSTQFDSELSAVSTRVMEMGETEQIFFKPKRRETEDYITGRFG